MASTSRSFLADHEQCIRHTYATLLATKTRPASVEVVRIVRVSDKRSSQRRMFLTLAADHVNWSSVSGGRVSVQLLSLGGGEDGCEWLIGILREKSVRCASRRMLAAAGEL